MARSARRRMWSWQQTSLIGLVCLAAVAVLAAATGFDSDAFFLVVLAFFLLALERTIGDWLAEKLGAGPAVVTMIVVVIGVLCVVLSAEGGRRLRIVEAVRSKGEAPVLMNGPNLKRSPTGPGAARSPAPLEPSQPAATGPASPANGPGIVPESSTAVPPVGVGRRRIGLRDSSTITLRISPSVGAAGQRMDFHATVRRKSGAAATGTLEFLFQGRPFARVPVDDHGVARAQWTPRVPGTYRIDARYSGWDGAAPSSSTASVTVLSRQSRR